MGFVGRRARNLRKFWKLLSKNVRFFAKFMETLTFGGETLTFCLFVFCFGGGIPPSPPAYATDWILGWTRVLTNQILLASKIKEPSRTSHLLNRLQSNLLFVLELCFSVLMLIRLMWALLRVPGIKVAELVLSIRRNSIQRF